MSNATVEINRAPVLTLWGVVVAERLGFDADAALTLGRCLAGLNAQAKGRAIGVFTAPPHAEKGAPSAKTGLGEEFWIEICGRPLPAKNTEDGIRAVVKDQPISPDKVREYLDRSFGESLPAVREAMEALAAAHGPDALREAAYGLYERFRPAIERGKGGWGQKGTLDLDLIRSLAPGRLE
jgi:hypothetical protein